MWERNILVFYKILQYAYVLTFMWTQFMTKKIKISNYSPFLVHIPKKLLATFTFLISLKSIFWQKFDQTTRTIFPVNKESKIFSGHFVYLFKVPTLGWKKTRMLVIFKWWGLSLMRLQRLLLLQEKKNRSLILSHNHVKKSPRMRSPN